VILISLDTLAADHLSSFGNAPGVSPELDALFRQAFSFRRAYAQYPNTLTSHASLFTSLYPKHHGVYYGAKTYARLQFPTIADAFAARGYVTAAFTEDGFVSSDFGFDRGFDRYDDDLAVPDKKFAGDAVRTFAKATRWIESFGAQARFYLFVHTYEVHAPYTLHDAESQRLVDRLDPGYEGPFKLGYPAGWVSIRYNTGVQTIAPRDLTHMAALYAGEIEYLDRIVGAFVRHLETLPLAGRTLVVITADHGEGFGEHGRVEHSETLYNHVLHVPLAFYWPGHVTPGSSQAVVELVDVMPTILDLAGMPAPPGLDGRSLAARIRGAQSRLPPRPAYAELRSAFGYCVRAGKPVGCLIGQYAVQTAGFKLIESKVPPFTDLYDLSADPGEQHDVAAQFPDKVKELGALLADYVADKGAKPSAAPPPAAIDNATRQRLKALGYLQ
jgi:arylsulfatase A-like enzyme